MKLSPEQKKHLLDLIWLCKMGNFTEEESLELINSGELGFHKQTKNKKIKSIKRPLTISHATYYRYVKILDSPSYQFQEIFQIVRKEYVSEIVKRWHLFHHLEAKSMRALDSEKDPIKQQLIINGIFKNSVYITSFMDILRNIVEHNKLPYLNETKFTK